MRALRTHLTIAALVAAAMPAFGGDLEQACEKIRLRQVPALVELGDWCTEHKLFMTRRGIAEQILAIDSSSTRAHKWLRHKLAAGGKWVPPARPLKVRDHAEPKEVGYPAQRTRLIGGIALELFGVLVRHGDAVTPGQRERLLEEVISLDPDNEAYRAEHGEVMGPRGWELQETATARKRRKDLRNAARDSIDRVGEPRRVAVPLHGDSSNLEWIGAWATKSYVAVATTSKAEARDAVRAAQAAQPFVHKAIGLRRGLRVGTIFYLMNGKQEGVPFVTSHPSASAHNRAHAKDFGAQWIGESVYASYGRRRAWRVESAAGSQVSRILRLEFGISSGETPWAGEGFETRLTWELVGTRVTHTRRLSDYSRKAASWASLENLHQRDWYEVAHELLLEATPVDLVELYGRPLNLLSAWDYVVANAIAAYYVEGRPTEVRKLLGLIGKRKAAADAIREVSDLDPEALLLRLRRWLEERGPDRPRAPRLPR